jgi:hypothetical protein
VNIKKIFASMILFSGTTSLIFVQCQQPASASFLDDVSDFLKGAEIGYDWAKEIGNSTNPDGTIDYGKTIRATSCAVDRVREATSDSCKRIIESPSPQQNYQSPTEEYSAPDTNQDEQIPDAS